MINASFLLLMASHLSFFERVCLSVPCSVGLTRREEEKGSRLNLNTPVLTGIISFVFNL